MPATGSTTCHCRTNVLILAEPGRARALDTLGVHPPPGMTSRSSALNPLDPFPERWLAGAVVELSSSEVARAAAAAWLSTYERARALGCDPDDAEACADSAYDDALSEFERTAIFDFEKSGEED